MPASKPLRRLASALGALAIGCVLALVLFEAVLWGIHWLGPQDARSVAEHAGSRTVLCLGDSNTFGIHLRSDAAYPGRLQQFLDRREDNDWRVVNGGFPGMNTPRIRASLGENLERYEPEVVVLLAGVNNLWSSAMTHLWETPDSEPEADGGERVLQTSRALSALRLIWSGTFGTRSEPQLGVPQDPKAQRLAADVADRGSVVDLAGVGPAEADPSYTPNNKEYLQGIRIDVARMQTLCDAAGAQLVLCRYPVIRPALEKANNALSVCAQELGLPLVELDALIRPSFEALGEGRLTFDDGHANALGNYEVARIVLEQLQDQEVLPGHEAWRSVPSLEVFLAEPRTRARLLSETRARVECFGPPRAELLVEPAIVLRDGGAGGPGVRRLGLAELEALIGGSATSYAGRLDEDGYSSRDLVLPALEPGVLESLGLEGRPVGWEFRVRLGVEQGELVTQPVELAF